MRTSVLRFRNISYAELCKEIPALSGLADFQHTWESKCAGQPIEVELPPCSGTELEGIHVCEGPQFRTSINSTLKIFGHVGLLMMMGDRPVVCPHFCEID